MKLYFAVILWLVSVYCEEVPPFIKICHKSDPHLSECIIDSVEFLRPSLITGIPELNIPSIEPLIIDELINDKAAGLQLIAKNVKAYGCSNFTVKELKLDLDNQIYEIDIFIPLLQIQSLYKVDGKLLLIPLKGDGNFYANLTNIKSKSILKGEIYNRDQKEYLRFVSYKLKANVEGGHVLLENMFGGEKFLSDTINDSINKNLHMFLKELMPVIDRSLASLFLNIANKITESYSVDQLFPE